MTRIYEITTELPETGAGHTYDRFNVVANTCEEALKKAKNNKNMFGKERVQGIRLLASAE